MKNTNIYTDTGRDKGRDWTMIIEKNSLDFASNNREL